MSEVIRPEITMPAPRRLTPRVWAERPGTSFEAITYRLKKALATGDQAAAIEARKSLTDEEWGEFKKSLDGDADLIRGYWNPRTRKFDGQAPDPTRGRWNSVNPRPEQKPDEPAAAKRPLVVTLGTGDARKTFRPTVGAIIHFDTTDGQRLHAKIKTYGPAGAQVITASGDEYRVGWNQIHAGIAPESAVEGFAKSWRPPLYAMTPEERAILFRARGDLPAADEAPVSTPKPPRRWLRIG